MTRRSFNATATHRMNNEKRRLELGKPLLQPRAAHKTKLYSSAEPQFCSASSQIVGVERCFAILRVSHGQEHAILATARGDGPRGEHRCHNAPQNTFNQRMRADVVFYSEHWTVEYDAAEPVGGKQAHCGEHLNPSTGAESQ